MRPDEDDSTDTDAAATGEEYLAFSARTPGPDGALAALFSMDPDLGRVIRWTSKAQGAGNPSLVVGRYLWDDAAGGLVPGQPSMLLGQAVEIDDAMPDIGAGSFPIVFGDWRRALWIVNRPAGGTVSIVRDDYTQRTEGKVRFHARQRVGAGVVRPEALVKVRVGTV